MLIRRGEIRHLEISFDPAADVSGLRVGANSGGTIDLEDVTIDSPNPLGSGPQASPDPETVTARRLVVHSADPVSVFDGFLELRDSVIDVSSAATPTDPENFVNAVRVADGRPPTPAGLTLDRVTLIGNGDPASTALSVAGQGARL